MLTAEQFLSCVDHTLLKPEATRDQIIGLCTQAADIGCFSVCINGTWVPTAAAALANSKVKICAVIGFPLGAMATAAKAFEAKLAVSEGADEIDMVINIGNLRGAQYEAVVKDIQAVRDAIGEKIILKIILETALLTDDEIRKGCRAVKAGGGNFVKTSTGFNPAGGASMHAVRLIREVVGMSLGIKAAGGIRTLADVEFMIEAGATRLGLSSTVAILKEIRAD